MRNPLCKNPYIAKIIRNDFTVPTNIVLLGKIAKEILNGYDDIDDFIPTNDFENVVYDYFHGKLTEQDTLLIHKEIAL